MKKAVLTYQKGGYDKLPEELKDFLTSAAEKDVQHNKHIELLEEDDVPTARLAFIDEEGKAAETIFAEHVPVSMLKDLIKEKNWIT